MSPGTASGVLVPLVTSAALVAVSLKRRSSRCTAWKKVPFSPAGSRPSAGEPLGHQVGGAAMPGVFARAPSISSAARVETVAHQARARSDCGAGGWATAAVAMKASGSRRDRRP